MSTSRITKNDNDEAHTVSNVTPFVFSPMSAASDDADMVHDIHTASSSSPSLPPNEPQRQLFSAPSAAPPSPPTTTATTSAAKLTDAKQLTTTTTGTTPRAFYPPHPIASSATYPQTTHPTHPEDDDDEEGDGVSSTGSLRGHRAAPGEGKKSRPGEGTAAGAETATSASSSSSRSALKDAKQGNAGSGGGTSAASAARAAAAAALHTTTVVTPNPDTASRAWKPLSAPVSPEVAAARRAQERRTAQTTAFNPLILCPLLNLGNTCYFNSGVQLLACCPAMVYSLRDSPLRRCTNTAQELMTLRLSRTGGPESLRLYQAFARLLHDMEFKQLAEHEALSPLSVLDSLGVVFPAFQGRSQQDCMEMVSAVLACMEDEGRLDVEVSVLLRSLVQDAEAHRRCYGTSTAATRSPISLPLGGGGSRPGSSPAPAAATTSSVNPLVQVSPVQPAIPTSSPSPPPLTQERSGGDASRAAATQRGGSHNSSTEPFTLHSHGESRRLADEEGDSSLPTPTTANTLALPGARSAHLFTVLQLMDRVDVENAALELKAKQRKEGTATSSITSVSTFRPPRLFFNSATDGFKGYTLSEIRCHHCDSVSRVVQPFTSLILDIPTQKQRYQFAKQHPEIRRLGPNGEPLQTKKSATFSWRAPWAVFTTLWRWLCQLLPWGHYVDYPLTLQECLDIHFQPALLRGSNRYKCDSCGSTSEATKTETVLALPEYLLLHMMRFEVGTCFNSKKTDPVIFPVSWTPLTPQQAAEPTLRGPHPEVLDLRDYVNPAVAKDLARAPPCLRMHQRSTTTAVQGPQARAHGSGAASGSAAATDARSIAAAEDVDVAISGSAAPHTVVSTYTLEGVVNHHGSYGGGHYTVYTHKQSREKDCWVFISDEEITSATVTEVADSEEYLLLYRKQALVQHTETDTVLRDKARCCLAEHATNLSSSTSSSPPSATTVASEKAPRGAAQTKTGTSAGGVSERTVAKEDDEGEARDIVYISRMWLQRMAFLSDPGPILNRMCYCSEADLTRPTKYTTLLPASLRVPQDVPHVHGPPVQWFYVPISPRDYEAFYNVYGGNAPVTPATYAFLQSEQERFVRVVREHEARGPGRGGGGKRVR